MVCHTYDAAVVPLMNNRGADLLSMQRPILIAMCDMIHMRLRLCEEIMREVPGIYRMPAEIYFIFCIEKGRAGRFRRWSSQ